MKSIYELRGEERASLIEEFIANFKFPLEVDHVGQYVISQWFKEFLGASNAASVCNTALGAVGYFKGVGDRYNFGAKKNKNYAGIVALIQEGLDPIIVENTIGNIDYSDPCRRAFEDLIVKYGEKLVQECINDRQ